MKDYSSSFKSDFVILNVSGKWGRTKVSRIAPFVLIAITFLISYSLSAQYLTGYALRKKLTIDNTKVCGASAHLNFPILVSMTDADLKTTGNGGGVENDNGWDIVFTQADGTTLLDHEMEKYVATTGELVAWVKIPSLPTGTDLDIYMYYGLANVAGSPSTTDTWEADYRAVYHLHDDFLDATDNDLDGTNQGSTDIAGKIGDGQDFEFDEDDKVNLGTFDVAAGTALTLSAWIKPESFNGVQGRIISKGTSVTSTDHIFMFSVRESSGMKLRLMLKTGGGPTTIHISNVGGGLVAGSWLYAAVTYDGTNIRFYENGVLVDTQAKTGTIDQSDKTRVAIGAQPNGAGDRKFDGIQDEIRVIEATRSTDWICTEYNNQNDPATFFTSGVEETCLTSPVGGTPTATNSDVYSGENTTVTLSGHSGTSIQWQSSTDNVSFTNIGGETDTILSTGAIAATTYYRVVVTQGACSAISTVDTVTVNSLFNLGYVYRKKITIDNAKVAGGTAHTDFPVFIHVTDDDLKTASSKVQNANGWDIAFTSADGTTTLQHEIHKYDGTTGEYIAWVKVPSLSAEENTCLYMYYGNCGVVADPSSTSTWNTNYAAVMHLQESGSGTTDEYKDATSNAAHGTGGGIPGAGNATATPTRVAGKFGFAQDFNDATSPQNHIGQQPIVDNAWTAFTIQAWVNAHDNGDDRIYGKTFGTGCSDQTWLLKKNTAEVGVRATTSVPNNACATNSNGFTNSVWQKVTVTWDASNTQLVVYLNGVEGGASQLVGAVLLNDASNPTIGNVGTSLDRGFDGLIQEVRVSNVALSAAWILTEYNNQNDPSTFFTVGDEEGEYGWLGTTDTDWGTGSNWSTCVVPPASANIYIPDGRANYPILDIDRTIGDLLIDAAASVDFSNDNLTMEGDLTNNGTLTASTSTTTIAGSTGQAIKGTTSSTLNNLTVNNASGLAIQTATTISGALTLTNGIVSTSATDLLTLSDGATASSGSSSSFIDGPIKKVGDEAFTFPTGDGSRWARIGITAPTMATTEYTAEYFASRYTDVDVLAPLNNVGGAEYWTLEQGVNNDDVQVTLFWEDDVFSGITQCTGADLRVAHYNSGTSQWELDIDGANITGSCGATPDAGSVQTNADQPNYSPFTFGSKSAVVNPLPVTLLSFDAKAVNENQVSVEWTTETEINNAYFEVEKSKDGTTNWTFVEQILGKGNSNTLVNYRILDKNPYPGVSYYRLKQADVNGVVEYFGPEVVHIQGIELISLFPNPSLGDQLFYTVVSSLEDNATFKIVDILGKVVMNQDQHIAAGQNHLAVNISSLSVGSYMIQLTTKNGNYKTQKQFMVK